MAEPRERREMILTRALFIAGLVLLVLMPLTIAVARFHGRRPTPVRILASHLAPSLRGRYAVLVVFQPRDCASYQGFIDSMGDLARPGTRPVLGIPVNAPRDREQLRRALADFAPTFPLAPELADDAVRVLGFLGYRTPIALVVDPQGRASFVIPPQPSPYRQAEVNRLAESFLVGLETGAVR